MKCFEVVHKVLEDTYDGVGGTEQARDAAISLALSQLSAHYRNNLLTQGGPPFDSAVNRFAYVYCYVPAHAHWTYELITWSPEAQALLAQEKVRVACIGGGPGSDLVGILKYLDEHGARTSLFCEIADGCVAWKQTWSDLAFTLDWPAPLHTDYVVQTVGSGAEWSVPQKFDKADIVTLNFFFSEIAHLGAGATDYIGNLLARLKSGAVLLFNDNNDTRFYQAFDNIAREAGLQVLQSGEEIRKVRDWGEDTGVVGRFAAKFNQFQPRLKGDVAWRVLKKP